MSTVAKIRGDVCSLRRVSWWVFEARYTQKMRDVERERRKKRSEGGLVFTVRKSEAVEYSRMFLKWTRVTYSKQALRSTAESSVIGAMYFGREYPFITKEAMGADDFAAEWKENFRAKFPSLSLSEIRSNVKLLYSFIVLAASVLWLWLRIMLRNTYGIRAIEKTERAVGIAVFHDLERR